MRIESELAAIHRLTLKAFRMLFGSTDSKKKVCLSHTHQLSSLKNLLPAECADDSCACARTAAITRLTSHVGGYRSSA